MFKSQNAQLVDQFTQSLFAPLYIGQVSPCLYPSFQHDLEPVSSAWQAAFSSEFWKKLYICSLLLISMQYVLVTFKHIPRPHRRDTQSFRSQGQLLKKPPLVQPNIAQYGG